MDKRCTKALLSLGIRANTYLFVELDESWLELLLNVALAEVVGELGVRERLALGSFLGSIAGLGPVRDWVERHGLVLRVADLVQLVVRHLRVSRLRRVVRRRVTGQLREVL